MDADAVKELFNGNEKDKDTYSYKGWIISDNFWRRSVAIAIYSTIPGILIMIIFMILIMIFDLILGGL